MAKALTPEQKRDRIVAAKEAEIGQEAQVRTTTDRGTRRTRNVFNGTVGKLTINPEIIKQLDEAGWHLHIFNDTPGRIEEALSAGYEFVTQEEIGSAVTSVVSRNTALDGKVKYLVGASEEGNGMYAYLMKTRKEYYEEDQEQLQKRNDYIDSQIRNGRATSAGDSSEGFYNAGISMKRN